MRSFPISLPTLCAKSNLNENYRGKHEKLNFLKDNRTLLGLTVPALKQREEQDTILCVFGQNIHRSALLESPTLAHWRTTGIRMVHYCNRTLIFAYGP